MLRPQRFILATFVSAFAALSCGSGEDPVGNVPGQTGQVVLDVHALTMIAGETRQLSAQVHNSAGAVISDRVVSWFTSNDQRAIVSLAGLVTAVAPGSVVIRATATAAKTDSVVVQVLPRPVAAVEIVPADSFALEVGTTSQLQVVLKDAFGGFLANRVITFSTEDASKVEVSTSGRVTAVKPGRVQVRAHSEGITGSTIVNSEQPPRDFSIRGAQITQAVQAADNSIPLVAGNPTVINVLLSAAPFKNIPMEVIMRLTDDAGNVLHVDTATSSGSIQANLTYQGPNAQFSIPVTMVRPGVRWQIVRDPRGRVGDDSTQNDAFPRTGPAALNPVNVPAVKIRAVPIVLNAHNGLAGVVTALTLPQLITSARALLPLATIDATVGASVTTNQAFGTPPAGGANPAFYAAVLSDLDMARSLDSGDPETYWYGVVPIPRGFAPIAIPTAAYFAANPQSTGAQTRASVGLTTAAALGIAHGFAMNVGRRHASCPAATNLDAAYPTAGGQIGTIAHDVRSYYAGVTTNVTPFAATALDVTCPSGVSRWISEYSYRGILNARGFTPATSMPAVRAAEPPVAAIRRVLIVRGTVSADAGVRLEPAFVTDARETPAARSGRYRVQGRSADGRVLFERAFEPVEIGGAGDYRNFLLTIPVNPDIEASLGAIEVVGPDGSARKVRPSETFALRATVAASAKRANTNQVDVACGDAGARGILVRDATSGAYLGSAAGATTRVSVPARTQLTVVCSDGVTSASVAVQAR